jgi:hypothetical protein
MDGNGGKAMRIMQSNVNLQAEYQQTQLVQQRQVRISISANNNETVARSSLAMDVVELSAQAQATQQSTYDVKEELPPKLALLKQLVERITGRKIRLLSLEKLHEEQVSRFPTTTNIRSGIISIREELFVHQQELKLNVDGALETSDGRFLHFAFTAMAHSEVIHKSSRIVINGQPTDPLVINMRNPLASLNDQPFWFDLNADGELDNIRFVQPGSGYLALDKNGNNQIDNGSELFGPRLGDGFAELAELDADNNGWIDENDPLFHKLLVWSRDELGQHHLNSLLDLGIGAICLQNTTAPFNWYHPHGQVLAQSASAGFFLWENGQVGSVQHLNFIV